MSPEDRDLVHSLLSGDLSREETVRAMDRIKSSEECRDYLAAQSRSLRGNTEVASDRPLAFGASQAPRSGAKSIGGAGLFGRPGTRRGGLIRTAVIGVIVILLFGFAQKSRQGKEQTQPQGHDLLVAEAIENGMPFIEEPRGTLDHRPGSVRLVLPPGQPEAVLLFYRGGILVWEEKHLRKDESDLFESQRRLGPEGRIAVDEVFLPFPAVEDLPFAKGEQLHLVVRLMTGIESAPASMRRND